LADAPRWGLTLPFAGVRRLPARAGPERARLEDFAVGGITSLCLTPICAPDELPPLIDGLLA
jgi:hypothetical protein